MVYIDISLKLQEFQIYKLLHILFICWQVQMGYQEGTQAGVTV